MIMKGYLNYHQWKSIIIHGNHYWQASYYRHDKRLKVIYNWQLNAHLINNRIIMIQKSESKIFKNKWN